MKRAMLVVVAMATISPARADVYGYVEENGTVHLATEALDARYALFLKSGDAIRAVPATSTPDATLAKTRLFQRLVDHPNIVKYEPMIREASLRHGLDPQLVKAVIAVESGFEPAAVSDKGAVGLMQILPATGERYGVRADPKKTVDAKLTDPRLNLEIGTRYLADLRRQFANRPDLALAAYNAGENAVVRYRNTIPPYPETVAYVKLVDQFHAFYNPIRFAADAKGALERERLRVVVPARRNLPDPNMPPRLSAGSVTVPPVVDGDR